MSREPCGVRRAFALLAAMIGHDDDGARPLGGARGWIITDGKVGMIVQCRGVADALGLSYEHKQVSPTGLARVLSPWLPPRRSERLGARGSAFAAPWPDVAIATGRLSIPYVRALKRLAGRDTFTVVLQNPRTGLNTADVIWVPQHDRLAGANVITTLTAPHSYSRARLSQLRRTMPAAIAALPAPRVAVVLGGPSGSYRFTAGDRRRLAGALASLAALSVSFLITPSRRTPAALLEAVTESTRPRPRILWDGEGENPYPSFLAHADLLIVTADSVNMTSEACATGRPVYVFGPTGGSSKFTRFHAALMQYGATRPLPDRVCRLTPWSYEPLNSACEIATQVEQRWLKQRAAGRALA
jgi:mitochondrial fission protein ELM1